MSVVAGDVMLERALSELAGGIAVGQIYELVQEHATRRGRRYVVERIETMVYLLTFDGSGFLEAPAALRNPCYWRRVYGS